MRTSLLATLEATYAVSEITESNVESMMSTLDGIVNAPNDLTTATAVGCLVFAKKLLSASVDGSIGISTTAAGYTGTAASYLLLSSMFNASVVESATAASAAAPPSGPPVLRRRFRCAALTSPPPPPIPASRFRLFQLRPLSCPCVIARRCSAARASALALVHLRIERVPHNFLTTTGSEGNLL